MLSADPGYAVGSPAAANLTIADNDGLPEVTIIATDPTAIEAGPNTGEFKVTRSGSTTAALTVFYSAGGTADYDTQPDYSGLPNFNVEGDGWVTIPMGSSTAVIAIALIDDAVAEGDETVLLTLAAWPSYSGGTPGAATVTISDEIPGSYVTGASPSGAVLGPLDRFQLTFNEAIQDGTFTLDDVVTLTGPSGSISATAVNKLTDTQYEIVFSSQTADGTYTLVVGREVLNLSGVPMDQDQDTVCGEVPDDRYTATVTITNDPPAVAAAIPDQTVNEDATIDLSSVFSDSDVPSGDSLTYAVLVGGAVSLLVNDTDADLPGDSLSVETTPVSGPASGVLTLGEDGDPQSEQQLTLAVTTSPGYGELSGFDAVTGEVTYTPDAGFTGTDSFSYTLTDDTAAGQPDSLTSEEGTIEISVEVLPTANVQNVTTGEDTQLSLTLTPQPGNPAGTSLQFSIFSQPSYGTLVDFDPETGQVTYVPDADFNGADSFGFVVSEYETEDSRMGLSSDRTLVTITVAAANDVPQGTAQAIATGKEIPVAVTLLGEDGDLELERTLSFAILAQPSHGTISDFDAAAGTLTYTPDLGYFGPDSFTFTVTDDATAGGAAITGAAATADVFIGAPPVADPQALTTGEDTPTSFTLTGADGDALLDVLANDTFDGSGSLGIVSVGSPLHGSMTIVAGDPQASGPAARDRVKFVPEAGYTGTETVSYTIQDASSNQSTASIEITVGAPGTPGGGGAAIIGGTGFVPGPASFRTRRRRSRRR